MATCLTALGVKFPDDTVQCTAATGGGTGGISNVVEDTTPQLGGNLDLNTHTINGVGSINITGSATVTELTSCGLTYPTADGTTGQFMCTDGAGNIGFGDGGGGGGSSLVGVTDTIAPHNTALGECALNVATTGGCNVAIGHCAASNLGAGPRNVSIGFYANESLNAGADNVSIGFWANKDNVNGNYNVSIGQYAGRCAAGNDNISVGRNAGSGMFGAIFSNNIAIGQSAGYCFCSASFNIYLGNCAGYCSCGGDYNIGLGWRALCNVRNGQCNIGIGVCALDTITDGLNNIGIGKQSMQAGSTACDNIAIGQCALFCNQTSCNNVSIGRSAAFYQTNGSRNVVIGHQSGQAHTNASGVVAIGAETSPANNDLKSITLGCGVTSNGSCNVTFGHGATKLHILMDGVTTSWTAASDCRLKCNIQDYTAGLNVVKALRPVTFEWKAKCDIAQCWSQFYDAESTDPIMGDADNVYHGFIAQEVKKIIDANPAIPNGQHIWSCSNEGIQGLSPSDLVPILVKAIQELEQRVQVLETQ